MILTLECMLFIFALVLDLKELVVAITIDFFIVSISLLAGKIKLQLQVYNR